MKNIEEKLKGLPRVKLGLRADKRIRFLIYKKNVKRNFQNIINLLHVKQRLVPASMAIIILSLVVLPSYAYASKKVTVGHVLYPVKTMMENVELKIANNKSEKLLKFSLRRIEEAEVVASEDDMEENVTTLMRDAVRLKNEANDIEEEKKNKKIENYKNESGEALAKVANKIGVESGDKVTNAVALALDGIKKRNDKKLNSYGKEKKLESNNCNNEKASTTNEANVQKENDFESTEASIDKKQIGKTKKEKDLVSLKNKVKKLEVELREENFEEEEVEILVDKLNDRIEKAEKESSEKKSNKIIKPTEALTDNAKYFMKKKSEKDQGSNSKKEKSKNGKNNGKK